MKKAMPVIMVTILVIILIGLYIFSQASIVEQNNNSNNIQVASNNLNTVTKTNISSGTVTETVSGKVYNSSDLFTDRDLEQKVDTSSATTYNVADNSEVKLTSEGVYVFKGTAQNYTIYVEVGVEDKVQIVLDGVNITNESNPCIYVKEGDKVFVSTINDSSLKVTGTFKADGTTNLDGVIFSKQDITFNGTAKLAISSTDNGIAGKDDVKFTGGTYEIDAKSKSVEANDSIRIADGTFTLTAGTDGLHSENEEDGTLGYIYIGGGTITINAKDDAIHGQSVVQIDGGTITIDAVEGIEGTYIQINDGTITINATDDGINAGSKSDAYSVKIEINGGTITINMGRGDTDGIDANGDIIVNGGTIYVTGTSTFDYDGKAELNGGAIYVNGTQVDQIPNQMMGGGNMGGMQGDKQDMRGNSRREIDKDFQEMNKENNVINNFKPDKMPSDDFKLDEMPPDDFKPNEMPQDKMKKEESLQSKTLPNNKTI